MVNTVTATQDMLPALFFWPCLRDLTYCAGGMLSVAFKPFLVARDTLARPTHRPAHPRHVDRRCSHTCQALPLIFPGPLSPFPHKHSLVSKEASFLGRPIIFAVVPCCSYQAPVHANASPNTQHSAIAAAGASKPGAAAARERKCRAIITITTAAPRLPCQRAPTSSPWQARPRKTCLPRCSSREDRGTL